MCSLAQLGMSGITKYATTATTLPILWTPLHDLELQGRHAYKMSSRWQHNQGFFKALLLKQHKL